MITLALLHPGSMGAAIGAEAVRAGARVLWVPEGRGAATQRRAAQAGLEAAPSLAEALVACDVALSVCPAHAAEDVARQVAATSFSGVYVEANPVSPERLRRIADILHSCEVVDGCVFGPDAQRQRVARIYLAGETPVVFENLSELFATTRVDVKLLKGPFGRASALKLAFINYQRAARTLTALSYALAEQHHVSKELLEEAAEMPRDILTDPDYITTLASRAWRWQHEMQEVAEALRAASLPPELAESTAQVMSAWTADKDTPTRSVPELLQRLHTEEFTEDTITPGQ